MHDCFKLPFGFLFAAPFHFVYLGEALRDHDCERETSRGFGLPVADQARRGVLTSRDVHQPFCAAGHPTNTSGCVGSCEDRLDFAVGIGLPLMMRLDMLMQRKVKKRGHCQVLLRRKISLQFKNTGNLELLISNLLPSDVFFR